MDNSYEIYNGGFQKYQMRNLEFPLASVDYFKMIYVESGILQISTASESFELYAGECRFFFPGEVHSAFTYEKNECKILHFERATCEDFFSLTFGMSQRNGIFKLEGDIDYFDSITSDSDAFMNKSNLYAMLSSFTQKVALKKSQSKDSEFISYVSNYVRKNCTSEITLQTLAQKLGYGYNYVSALFKKNFKCNFLFFVNQHRIAIAEKLLISRSDLSITDIAFECGFNSLRSFDRNFQMMKGETPKGFRDMHP